MNLKLHPISQFILLLAVSLALVFCIQIFLLEFKGFPKYGNLIIQSYIVNGILAASIYVGLYLARKKLKGHIGFLFMGGSFIKFIVFFIIFYPVYNADDKMDKIEFAAFFVPYAISLLIETVFMTKMLKKLNYK